RETPSDSRKCSHTRSFLTTFREAIRSVSTNCASFMTYGNTRNRGFLTILFTRTAVLCVTASNVHCSQLTSNSGAGRHDQISGRAGNAIGKDRDESWAGMKTTHRQKDKACA